jgi:hypothetical protein
VPRIKQLRSSPATVRFLSIEPLLEDIGEINLADTDWVIVGGESGFGARPMRREWVISIRKQVAGWEFRSSLSNGAVCTNRRQGGSLTDAPTTKCLRSLYREPWCRFKQYVKPGLGEMALEENLATGVGR